MPNKSPKTFPIDQLRTPGAKTEAARYRALGIANADLRFIKDDDGAEVIIMNKAAVLAFTKRSPLESFQCIANLRRLGVPLDLDDELAILAKGE